jgi:hypothetical protein
MDHEISALHALALWQAGEIPRDLTLWGHHLFFWERLGKMLEFVGALAIVVDLLGADRLGQIADELRAWTSDPEIRPTSFLSRPRVVAGGVAAIAVLATVALLTGSQKIDPVLPFTDIRLPAALAVAITILGLACSAYVLLALYFVLFSRLTAPIASYVAGLLQRRHADKWLKIISLPLLTLGFFLDLLGS